MPPYAILLASEQLRLCVVGGELFSYVRKLAAKYGSKIQPQSSPIPTSKAARDRFEAMEPASEDDRFDVSL